MKTTFILYENYQIHSVGLDSIVGSFVLHLHVTDSSTQIQPLNHMVQMSVNMGMNSLMLKLHMNFFFPFFEVPTF